MKQLKVADSAPEVGIWWVWNGKVLKYAQKWTEVVNDGGFLCVDVEHIQYWKVLQKEHPELKELRFDSIPRGRVWYNPEKQLFSITCSEKFSKNSGGVQAVKDSFDLNNRRLQIVVDQQYVE